MTREVDLFVPCFVDQLFPQAALNAVRVLEKAGCTVNYNPNQTCCGQPAFNAGHWDPARQVATKFLDDFSESKYIVILSSSCTGMVRNYYNELFANSALQLQYKHVKRVAYEFVEFLTKVLRIEDLGAEFNEQVVYHDACAALREVHVMDEPRALLSNVKGLEVLPMAGQQVCCGFGGTFCVSEEAVSVKMGKDRVADHLLHGAEYITGTDVSCLMHLEGILKRQGSHSKVIHLAEILNSSHVPEFKR